MYVLSLSVIICSSEKEKKKGKYNLNLNNGREFQGIKDVEKLQFDILKFSCWQVNIMS